MTPAATPVMVAVPSRHHAESRFRWGALLFRLFIDDLRKNERGHQAVEGGCKHLWPLPRHLGCGRPAHFRQGGCLFGWGRIKKCLCVHGTVCGVHGIVVPFARR